MKITPLIGALTLLNIVAAQQIVSQECLNKTVTASNKIIVACGLNPVTKINLAAGLKFNSATELRTLLNSVCVQSCVDKTVSELETTRASCSSVTGWSSTISILPKAFKLVCLKLNEEYCLVQQLEKVQATSTSSASLSLTDLASPTKTQLCGPCLTKQIEFMNEFIDVVDGVAATQKSTFKTQYSSLLNTCPKTSLVSTQQLITVNGVSSLTFSMLPVFASFLILFMF